MADEAHRPQSPGLGTPTSFDFWCKSLDLKQKAPISKNHRDSFPLTFLARTAHPPRCSISPGPLRVYLRLG